MDKCIQIVGWTDIVTIIVCSLPYLFLALTSAPCSKRILTVSGLPDNAALIRLVLPNIVKLDLEYILLF